MSPEQAAGDPVDHRSDLFSLGCVLYAMCTGRSPFRATSLAAAIRRVCDDVPRPIEEINPEAPAWLVGLIDRLLEKNPDDRPQSAEEVADVLGERLSSLQQPGRVPASEPITESAVLARRRLAETPRLSADSGSSIPREIRFIGRIAVWLGILLVAGVLLALVYGCLSAFVNSALGLHDVPPFVGLRFATISIPILLTASMLLLCGLFMQGTFSDRARLTGEGRGAGRLGTIRLIGRIAVVLGILLVASVLIAFVYVALGFPDLPPFEGRDFGTTVIPILLIALWLLLSGLFMQGTFRRPRRSSTKRREGKKPWDIRRIGRAAIWSGVGLFALPLFLIIFGYVVDDRYEITFVVQLFIVAASLGVLTIMLGCVTLLVAYAVGDRQGKSPPESQRRRSDHSGGTTTSPRFGWLLIGALTLIPALLLTSLVWYVSLDRTDPKLSQSVQALRKELDRRSQASADAAQRDAQQAEAEWLAMHQREWEEAATATFRFDAAALGSVGLALDKSSIDPMSAIDDIRPQEMLIRASRLPVRKTFDAGEINEIKLPPGTYHLWVHGKTFGWSRARPLDGMPSMSHMASGFGGIRMTDDAVIDAAVSRLGAFEITDDPEPETHSLTYDWQDIASRPPQPYSFHIEPHPNFYWNGNAYELNQAQAQVVQKLLVAFAAGSPDVPKAELTVTYFPFGGAAGVMGGFGFDKGFDLGDSMMAGPASPDGRTVGFVEAVFQNGQHPAWGTLIIPGETEGTSRLAAPQLPPPVGNEVLPAQTDPPPSGLPETSLPPATDSAAPESNNNDSPPPPPMRLDDLPAGEPLGRRAFSHTFQMCG